MGLEACMDFTAFHGPKLKFSLWFTILILQAEGFIDQKQKINYNYDLFCFFLFHKFYIYIYIYTFKILYEVQKKKS